MFKESIGQRIKRIGQNDGGQLSTVPERFCPDMGDGLGQMDGVQASAVGKGAAADGYYGLRQRDLREIVIARQRAVRDDPRSRRSLPAQTRDGANQQTGAGEI